MYTVVTSGIIDYHIIVAASQTSQLFHRHTYYLLYIILHEIRPTAAAVQLTFTHIM